MKVPEQLANELLEDYTAAVLRRTPKELKRLGKIIRNGSLKKLRRYVRKLGVDISIELTAGLRDYLIMQRIDMRDLEPDARARLRAITLKMQDEDRATEDYLEAKSKKVDIRCRDCQWFSMAPVDGNENEDKSCVALGTKGVDVPCVGFEWLVTTDQKSA